MKNNCPYCTIARSLYFEPSKVKSDVREVYIEDDTLIVTLNYGNGYRIKINYCPRCGKKLRRWKPDDQKRIRGIQK